MAVYYGNEFPALNGNLIVTSLKSQEVLNLNMTGNQVRSQTSLVPGMPERYRDDKIDTSGKILVITDSGKLIRLSKG
jgi:glucose/arabinose dehydrogenase